MSTIERIYTLTSGDVTYRVDSQNQTFVWNLKKARVNHLKHGITFEQAAQVFADPYKMEFYDDLHSQDEQRLALIGSRELSLVLLVIYTERYYMIDGKIDLCNRLISARRADKRDKEVYYEYLDLFQ